MATEARPAPLTDALRARVADRAPAVDAGRADPWDVLHELGDRGGLALGVAGRPGDVRGQAALVAELAERCMATAFCAWGHRMAAEYAAVGLPDATLQPLLDGAAPGSSAMAAGFCAHLGLKPLGVRARRDGAGVVLDGRIAWASNLRADATVLLAAAVDDGRAAVVAVPVAASGLTVRPATGLLALEATHSGTLVLDGVRVPAEAVSPEPFPDFVRRVRRTFLVLQSAFCVGVTRSAIASAAGHLDGLGAEFAPDHDDVATRLAAVEDRIERGADDPSVPMMDAVALRLEAGRLVRDAVAVEAAVVGGRGYVAASPTARRVREAAFLPVQSPTEGQLRWELRTAA